MKEPKFRLTLTREEAETLLEAAELMMRLQLGQHEELCWKLLDVTQKDFCDKRDRAMPFLAMAFQELYRGRPDDRVKDDRWHRLYNMYQVVRHGLWSADHIAGDWSVAASEPMQLTDVPLPKLEIL